MKIGRAPLAAALGCAWLSLLPGVALPQVPDKFENLQVLPKDVARQDLIETMRGFSFALGARCEHCHVGGPELGGMTFASDEKAAKKTARQMLLMTREINDRLLPRGEGSTLQVTCFTCHRGVLRPEPIESLIAEQIRSAGIESAIARYRELREQYLGSGSYSFGVTPLNRLAETLLGEGKPEAAVAVLRLNAEFHADSAWLQDLLGDASLKSGDREGARAAWEKSLSLRPDNPRTRAKLEELGSADTP